MSDVTDDFQIIDSSSVQMTRKPKRKVYPPLTPSYGIMDGKSETRFYLTLYRSWQRRNPNSTEENPYDKYLDSRWLYEIALEKTFSGVVDVCDDNDEESVKDESEASDDDTFMCFECRQTYEMFYLGFTEQGLHLCHDCYEDCCNDPDWRD